MIPEQFRRSPKRKYAVACDLERIDGIWYQNKGGMFGLKRSGKNLLQFFVTVARLGYKGIDAPIGAVTDALWRSLGQTQSERTVYRALSDLEENHFIFRKTFRVGENRLKTLIRFNMDSFRFLLEKKQPTKEHINTQLTKSQSSDRMNITVRVNSCNNTDLNKKPRARARAGSTQKTKHRYHPIVLTLRIVTKALCDRKKMTWKKRRVVLNVAELELAGSDLYESKSGIDWLEYSARWDNMSNSERDGVARSDILPVLLKGDKAAKDSIMPSSTTVELDVLRSSTRNNADRPIMDILGNHSPARVVSSPNDSGRATPSFPDFLSDEERCLLEAARRRSKAREHLY